MNTTEKTYTQDQLAIVNELCAEHLLDPTQISFDGNALTPIFDYEAVCALSLKLTDIRDISCEIKSNPLTTFPDKMPILGSIAVCTVTLPDGRTRTVEDSAEIGEEIYPGVTAKNRRDVDGMAQNRAVRRGIRSVGINLWNAHRTYMKTGEATEGSTEYDPQKKLNDEIHALAGELGFTREDYEGLIASAYDGRTTTLDLNDIERQNFAKTLRALRRIQKSRQEHDHKAAA